MKTLFGEEKIVSQFELRLVELTLTTYRICYEYSVWGNSHNQNIALEHITSCENKYSSQIGFAVVSLLSLIIGILIGTEISSTTGFALLH